MDLYKDGIRPLLFSVFNADPETAHKITLNLLAWLDHHHDQALTQGLQSQLQQSFCLKDVRLEQTLWGLKFPNPLGLAAGFDKDGVAARIWSRLGFGFAELGTVTCHPQPGNPPPRLFRLVEDQAVLNRMGFNNQGAAALASRLSSIKVESTPQIPLGINLGKSKITPLESAAEDYLTSFRYLKEWGDYFVINVSSPNTPGLRSLQDATQLRIIFDVLQQDNQGEKPILVKIAPDLEWEAIADVIHLTQTYHLAGIVATNTTIRRDHLNTQIIKKTGKPITEETGGISGAPLQQRSTEVIRFIHHHTQGTLPIIGVGGIFTAEEAWEKMTAGASLIQVYTGLVYEGPGMIRRILTGLLQKLETEGLTSIAEVEKRRTEINP